MGTGYVGILLECLAKKTCFGGIVGLIKHRGQVTHVCYLFLSSWRITKTGHSKIASF